MPDGLKVFTGNSNACLAEEVCQYLDIPLGDANINRFSDGEIQIQIDEDIRGTDVFIVQSTNAPSDNLLELLLMLDAVKRASAWRVTAVMPYFGYARQDRKSRPRVPISSKLVANLITTAGADRILAMDLHAPQIQGFFDIPLDHLYSAPVFTKRLLELNPENMVIASPDAGGMAMARSYGKRLNCPLALVDKRRPRPNVAEVVDVIGDVDGKDVIIRDDMIDTGGSITGAAAALLERGANTIYAACTHAILSGKAMDRLGESQLTKLIVSNTIKLATEKQEHPKLEILSVAPLLGEAIHRIHEAKSVSALFDPTDQT